MKTREIIGVIILALCFSLQFFVSGGIGIRFFAIILSMIVLLVAPSIIYKVKADNEPSKAKADGKWIDTTFEKIDEYKALYADYMNESNSHSGIQLFYTIHGLLTNIVSIVILIIVALILAAIENGTLACIALDLWLVTRYLGKMIGLEDNSYNSCLDMKYDTIMLFTEKARSIQPSFDILPQIYMNSPESLDDIRLKLIPKSGWDNLKCSLVSVTENAVMGSRYPFAYFASVLKSSKSNRSKYFQIKTESKGRFKEQWNRSGDKKDPASATDIFLILKRSEPAYSTNEKDIECLAQLANMFFHNEKVFTENAEPIGIKAIAGNTDDADVEDEMDDDDLIEPDDVNDEDDEDEDGKENTKS